MNDRLFAELEAALVKHPLPWPADELIHLLEMRLVVEDDGSLRIQHTDGTLRTVEETISRAQANT